MFASFEMQDGTPRDIRQFELLWLLAIVMSAVVAFGMYDYSQAIVGHLRAILFNTALFGTGATLMGLASRRRSDLARWLLIPFALFVFFYDLSHFAEMLDRGWMAYFVVARIGLMVAAIYFLFTPRPRAWFAGTPLAPGGDDDWS